MSSDLLGVLGEPDAMTVAVHTAAFGDGDKSQAWRDQAEALFRPGKTTWANVIAAVSEMVDPLPIVRWFEGSLFTARPKIKAVRMLGGAFPKRGEPSGFTTVDNWYQAGYVALIHVEAGSAWLAGSAWEWDEQIVMMAREGKAGDLWTLSDSHYPGGTHFDLLTRMDKAQLMAGVPVLFDWINSKQDRLSISSNRLKRLRGYALMRERAAIKMVARSAQELPLLTGSGAVKAAQDAPYLELWREAATAQRIALGG